MWAVSQSPAPEDLICGFEDLNLPGQFLARRVGQEIKQRVKDSRHRDTIARCGIFRDDKVFLPRRRLCRVRFLASVWESLGDVFWTPE